MIDKQKLYAALNLIAKGIVQPTKVAKGIGMPYRTYRSWMVRSNQGDPAFLIEADDGSEIQWAAAIVQARRLAMLELRGMLEQYSIYGKEIETRFNGAPVWRTDPVAAALPEDIREMCGYRKDALLEIDGALQPVMQHQDAPIQLQLRLLEATFKDMRPQSVQEVNVSGGLAVGIGFAPKTDYSQGPPMVPPPPPRPVIEGSFVEVDDLEDLLGPEPITATEPSTMKSNKVTEMDLAGGPMAPVPERVIRDTAKASETPPVQEGILAPSKPLGISDSPTRPATTPLMQDLYAKLAAARARSQT